MNKTPSANRTHIAFFGRRNAGKSSLLNAVTSQNLAVVSDVKGTTTDPVYKTMELLPLGPVVMIDTPGFDDEGDLGNLRVQKTRQVLNKTDIAVLVLDEQLPPDKSETEIIELFKAKNIPYIIAHNKSDISPNGNFKESSLEIRVSAKTGLNINLLKEKIASIAADQKIEKPLVSDLIKSFDFVILVIPIDESSPKGRLILPQQQVIRDILEAGGIAITVKDSELEKTLETLGKETALVITDSQVFATAAEVTPPEIPLTSFSILFARYKGFLESALRGVAAIDNLKNGDKVLICEGCTHHRQCEDIGTVKIPRMIKKHTSKELNFVFYSGGDFPEDLSDYKLIIHCGGCMLNEREMHYRRLSSEEQSVPFTNYGTAIAHIQGILKRSTEVFSNPAS